MASFKVTIPAFTLALSLMPFTRIAVTIKAMAIGGQVEPRARQGEASRGSDS